MREPELHATAFLGPVPRAGHGGDSQPQRIRLSDGFVYAVKFPDNPAPKFGRRPLAAELLASRVARSLGVRTPHFRVVTVTQRFLAANPSLTYDTSPPLPPAPARCLASRWIDDAQPVTHDQVPISQQSNAVVLARLFLTANLLCLNPGDHDQPYRNLLLDSENRLWALDWGHPFWFAKGPVSDWRCLRDERYVRHDAPAAKGLLSLAAVAGAAQRRCHDAADAAAAVAWRAIGDVPPEWGISEEELCSAAEFILARSAVLPGLVAQWLRMCA